MPVPGRAGGRFGWPLLLAATIAVAGPEPRAPVVEVHGDRLSIRADDATLRAVLDALAQATGATVRGPVPPTSAVTLHCENVPLDDGLTRLLGARNYALVYGEGGRLRAIELLGGPPVPPPPADREAGDGVAGVDTLPQAEVLGRLVDAGDTIALPGRLARTLGVSRATFARIAEAAARQPDARLRTQALRVIWRHLRADPQVRSAFVTVMNAADDRVLAQAARNVGREHAEELLRIIVRFESGGPLHAKATGVLRELRTLPPPAAPGA